MYGIYYSFDGRRWYFAGECEFLATAFVAARSAASVRAARFARVTNHQDVPVWEVAV